MACLSPSPVTVLTPVFGAAATTSWPRWRRVATVFEPIRPVPPDDDDLHGLPPLSKMHKQNAATRKIIRVCVGTGKACGR
jgi:hypothetical protein